MALTLKKYESEKDTEKYLVQQIRKLGGHCVKLLSVNSRGLPDRLCVLPLGIMVFVEVKSENGVLSPLQKILFADLEELGHTVHVIYTRAEVKELIKNLEDKIQWTTVKLSMQ